jgi:putative Mg2+ transporter-C (MgtC) family protein
LVNRQPLDSTALEATNTVYVISSKDMQREARVVLEEALNEAKYPARKIVVHAFGDKQVEIEATLTTQLVIREELDGIVTNLGESPCVQQAFWSPSDVD